MEPSQAKCSKILLTLSAEIDESLANSQALAFVQLDVQDSKSPVWDEVGKSSTITMQRHMRWTSEFELNYQFQSQQRIKVFVFKFENNQSHVVCTAQTFLHVLVKSSVTQIEACDTEGNPAGLLTFNYSEDKEDKQKIFIQFAGERLADLDYFDKSDPYYLLYRQVGGDWALVQKSEVIDNNLFPKWDTVIMKYSEFCGNNPECLMKLECYDFDSESKSEYMGRTIFKAKDLVPSRKFELKNEKKGNETGGFINVIVSQIIQESSFLDHLTQGMQLNVSLGIDFTASNGLPTNNNSLHYFSEDKESEYAQAIRSLAEVLKAYDSDGRIPLFGFGGEPAWFNGLVKHDFALNGREDDPYVSGFDEAIQVYKDSLNRINLKGPTLFKPLIDRIISQFTNQPNTYNIFIILTDGDIDDYQETANIIVQATRKPLSIIIVGVGYENFTKMEQLDGDQKALANSRGIKAVRDIVQFVRFRSFKHQLHYFTEKALEEIPAQIMKYINLSQ